MMNARRRVIEKLNKEFGKAILEVKYQYHNLLEAIDGNIKVREDCHGTSYQIYLVQIKIIRISTILMMNCVLIVTLVMLAVSIQ